MKKTLHFQIVSVFLIILCIQNKSILAQEQWDSPLTVRQIMQEPDSWVGDWPENIRWHENGEAIYFDWNPKGAFPADSLYRVSTDGGDPVKVPIGDRLQPIPLFDGWHHGERMYSADDRLKVFAFNGDIYLYDRRKDHPVQLTDTQTEESHPRFSGDDSKVIFTQDANLFALHLATGALHQVTDIRSEGEPKEPSFTAQEAYLKKQQLQLFESFREERQKKEQQDLHEKRVNKLLNQPPTFYTDGKTVEQLQIDPTGRFVTFALQGELNDSNRTIVPEYVTLSGFTESSQARPKVGVAPRTSEFYIQDLHNDTTYAVDFHQLPGADSLMPYQNTQSASDDSLADTRALYSYGLYWNRTGSHGVIVVGAVDNKDRWIARIEPETGQLTLLDRQYDDAWIGGPGISRFGFYQDIPGWMPDNVRFYYQSEATGYSHLYTINVQTGEKQQFTSGSYEIYHPQLSRDGQSWVFMSNKASPHERHVYRMPGYGGTITRLTQRSGSHRAFVSPDENYIAVNYSSTNQPPDLYLRANVSQNTQRRLTHSPTKTWKQYAWRDPEIVTISASDGVEVPAQIFLPDSANGAAVLFIHGAGYMQNVIKGWSHYFHEYMFHNLLTDLGYIVLNIDYRGSAGYGRDWRTAIYRHMGGRDLQDYIDASQWLSDRYKIDPERQFIYGGSYGGFLTLMALFTADEHFGGGAALRPVTDWAHYNHPYTSNILNIPYADTAAYRQSSPIYFAEGLHDPLLMAHGLVDLNVQIQDVFRLTQRFIELGKENWQLAIYPVEGHSFKKPSSWADEYRRILKLIEDTIGPNRIRNH